MRREIMNRPKASFWRRTISETKLLTTWGRNSSLEISKCQNHWSTNAQNNRICKVFHPFQKKWKYFSKEANACYGFMNTLFHYLEETPGRKELIFMHNYTLKTRQDIQALFKAFFTFCISRNLFKRPKMSLRRERVNYLFIKKPNWQDLRDLAPTLSATSRMRCVGLIYRNLLYFYYFFIQ